MAAIQDVINLYVSTMAKWKDKAEKNAVMRGAVSGNAVFVEGQACAWESVSPGLVANGDVVYVAQTRDDGRVVVLG